MLDLRYRLVASLSISAGIAIFLDDGCLLLNFKLLEALFLCRQTVHLVASDSPNKSPLPRRSDTGHHYQTDYDFSASSAAVSFTLHLPTVAYDECFLEMLIYDLYPGIVQNIGAIAERERQGEARVGERERVCVQNAGDYMKP